jgi:hypothetical protein
MPPRFLAETRVIVGELHGKARDMVLLRRLGRGFHVSIVKRHGSAMCFRAVRRKRDVTRDLDAGCGEPVLASGVAR